MLFRKSFVIASAAFIVGLFLISSASAQDSLLINYQGRLTDSSGGPITDSPAITFTIYDGAGASKWAESFPSVPVVDGLFDVILGSQTALPVAVFDGEDRYLGITVGTDPEMTPRTPLVWVPHAAVAYGLAGGNLETGEYSLTINNEQGDSAIILSSTANQNDFTINFGLPVDPMTPAFEFNADGATEKATMKMGFPPDPINPVFEVVSDGSAEQATMKMGVPIDPHIPAFEFSADGATEKATMNMGFPIDPMNPAFGVTADHVSDITTMKLGAPIDPIAPAFEFSADGATEQATIKMGIPIDPYTPAFGVTADHVSDITTMKLGVPIDPIAPAFEFSADGATEQATIKMGIPIDPMNPAFGVTADHVSDITTMKLGTPIDPIAPAFEFSADGAAEQATMKMGAPVDPHIPAFEFTADGATEKATMKMGWPVDPVAPAFEFSADGIAERATMKMGFPVDPHIPGIIMTVEDSTARVGIGVENPTEALEVAGKVSSTVGGFMYPDSSVQTTAAIGGGVAQAVDITDNDTLYGPDTKDIIQQSIDCPANGYVLVIASCDATISHHFENGNPRFMFGVSNSSSTLAADQRKEWYIQELMEPGYYSNVISVSKIFPVSSGFNTFYMCGYRSNTTGSQDSCWIDNKTFSLIFMPNAYGTVEQ